MVTYNSGFTLEKLAALESAIAEGALKVKYNDKEVEYRTLDDMMKIREAMRKVLCVNTVTAPASKGLFGGKRITAIHSKGLD